MANPHGLICCTRALKNAKYLQRVAFPIMPQAEPPEGFGSIIPLRLLASLHRPNWHAPAGFDDRLKEQLKQIKFPQAAGAAASPLFNGTLFFASVQFTIQNQNNAVISVRGADTTTALNYATAAAIPISQYASQYGPNSITVSQNVLPFQVTLPGNTYNDTQLQGFINSVASQNNLGSNACVIVLNPQGVVNTSAAQSAGVGGYHSKANVPYIMVNVSGQNFTLSDPGFLYAGNLSHEIAEMVVDPVADLSNPEVCDPCGPNCVSTFLDYFDAAGNYIATSQALPPSFDYSFYINGIVRPAFAAQCPPSDQNTACNYPPVIDTFSITTDTAPAAAGRQDNLFVFVRAGDGHILFNQAAPGAAFVGWQEVPGGIITDAAISHSCRAALK
jgi:hypothetical protein